MLDVSVKIPFLTSGEILESTAVNGQYMTSWMDNFGTDTKLEALNEISRTLLEMREIAKKKTVGAYR